MNTMMLEIGEFKKEPDLCCECFWSNRSVLSLPNSA